MLSVTLGTGEGQDLSQGQVACLRWEGVCDSAVLF